MNYKELDSKQLQLLKKNLLLRTISEIQQDLECNIHSYLHMIDPKKILPEFPKDGDLSKITNWQTIYSSHIKKYLDFEKLPNLIDGIQKQSHHIMDTTLIETKIFHTLQEKLNEIRTIIDNLDQLIDKLISLLVIKNILIPN